MKHRFEVVVSLRSGLLDPQGKAVEGSLPAMGWTNVSEVRVGKHVVLTVEAFAVGVVSTISPTLRLENADGRAGAVATTATASTDAVGAVASAGGCVALPSVSGSGSGLDMARGRSQGPAIVAALSPVESACRDNRPPWIPWPSCST